MTAERVAFVQTEVVSLELFETAQGFECRRVRPSQAAETQACKSVFDVQEFFGRGPAACQLYRDWLSAGTVSQ